MWTTFAALVGGASAGLTDAILALALIGADGPTGTFRDRNGELPW